MSNVIMCNWYTINKYVIFITMFNAGNTVNKNIATDNSYTNSHY